MKRLFLSLILISLTQFSFSAPVGVPVKITPVKGKPISGYFQKINGGKVTFLRYRAKTPVDVPVDKIKSVEFLLKYDHANLDRYFKEGKYSSLTIIFGPNLKPYWDYMGLKNNLQPDFFKLIDSYLYQKKFDKVERAGKILMQSSDPEVLLKGQIYMVWVALSDVDSKGVVRPESIRVIEKIKKEMDSASGKLYLQACIDQAKGKTRQAFRSVCFVIANHANDPYWMPKTELLSAYLYLDSHLTNSAIKTAQQVQSMYAGSDVADNAKQFIIDTEKAVAEAKVAAEKRAKERVAEKEKELAALNALAMKMAVTRDALEEEGVVKTNSTDVVVKKKEADEKQKVK